MSLLEDFLTTGRLGNLAVGLTVDEVVSELGSPTRTSTGWPALWTYGPLDLTFAGEGRTDINARLIGLGLNFEDLKAVLPGPGGFEVGKLGAPLTLDDFQTYCLERFGNFEFSSNPRGTSEAIRFRSGVTAYFDDEGQLHSIRFVAPSTTRQMTVSFELPEAEYEQVRKMLAARGLSASALVSELLREQIVADRIRVGSSP